MQTYKTISLPLSFTNLLKINLQEVVNSFDQISNYILQHKELKILMASIFSDVHPSGEIRQIVKSLGWHGTRNRIASIFLHFQIHGHYPTKVEPCVHVDEIVDLESELMKYTVSGFSRTFLFLFYMKMKSLKYETEFRNEFFDTTAHLLLEGAKSKIVQMDWVLVTLEHLDHFIGTEKLQEMLKANKNYEYIYDSLTESQQDRMIINSLAYGGSTFEKEIFCYRRI
jgi:hypothetical protein